MRRFLSTFAVEGSNSTRLRVQVTVDGVLLPDLFFDHPNFTGSTLSAGVYAEQTPAQPTQYTLGAVTSGVSALSKNSTIPTYPADDSRNPVNYAV